MARKSRSEITKAADIIEAISRVTKEKNIPMDLVLDTLKDALITGAKRLLLTPARIETKVDREKGTIEVYTRQTVVEQVEDPETEIWVEDAKEIDPELEIGDELMQDLDVDIFGRTAIQTAKQVIIQRVREAERTKIFEDFSERVGELITGTVQQIDKGNILVNLGRTEALMPYREQIRKERYRQGDNIRACIVEVKNNIKGPQVIVSRACPEFLARLFELEVPEIYDKTVQIVKVVRDPGHRAKIAVTTSDSRVDPVGACVGMRGNRVQAIVRELSNERIDIINWTEEQSLLVRRVFSPADVKRVFDVTETKLVVLIAEEDLAQAIGREGQNIRLAARMIGKEIDIYGDEEFAAKSEEEREEILNPPPEPVADTELEDDEDFVDDELTGEDDELLQTSDASADAHGTEEQTEDDEDDEDDEDVGQVDDDPNEQNDEEQDSTSAIVEHAVEDIPDAPVGADTLIGESEQQADNHQQNDEELKA
jgi:N utilization substance protein A